MSMDFWNIVTALAACVAAVGSVAAAWALYHTRMLDCNFMAEPAVYGGTNWPVLTISLSRSKAGGPYGRLAGIEVDPKFNVRVAAQLLESSTVGSCGYSGSSWKQPVFSHNVDCDLPFSPSSTSFAATFWVEAAEAIEFRAVLIFEYKRTTVLAKRVEIFARAIPSKVGQS